MINIDGIKYYTYNDIKAKAKTKLDAIYPNKNLYGKKAIGTALKTLGYIPIRKNINGINCHFYVTFKDYKKLTSILL